MEFKEVLTKRRSVRKFSPTVPSREVLLDIVRDALTAPSSRNMHTTRFMIVDDRETLDKIAEMRDYGSSFMTGAPAAIVVMGDTTKTDLFINSFERISLLNMVVSNLQLKQCIACAIPRVTNAIVIPVCNEALLPIPKDIIVQKAINQRSKGSAAVLRCRTLQAPVRKPIYYADYG